ncbi:MAG: tRNA preQ1(34) S-adenosylmethionine ribosyltransferase-isomerase QueA, partial [Patescibacteria group bacterium]
ILYLNTVGDLIEVMSDKKLSAGQKLFLNNKLFFEVIKQQGSTYFLKPPVKTSQIYNLLIKRGLTPLPPYLKASRLEEGKRRLLYQTVFAKDLGSVAAPTAALHFTKRLLSNLKKQGHQICFVTLHVNLGTFATLKPEQVKNKKLHSEFWQIPDKTRRAIWAAQKQGSKIVAVGTTVVRTLESAGNYQAETLVNKGTTQLFISPGYKFKTVDCLITNFHVPSSSLMMLVAAITGRQRLLNIYRQAIKKKFRFFSFGDGMLIK